jgi:hypothetical protein
MRGPPESPRQASLQMSFYFAMLFFLPSVVVYDKRSPRVPKAGVHLPLLVAGTEHLRVQLKINTCFIIKIIEFSIIWAFAVVVFPVSESWLRERPQLLL